MIAMEDSYKEELKKKLESGEISQDLYDEIMKRWNGEEKKTDTSETETKSEKTKKEGRTSISGSGHLSNVVSQSLNISGSGRVSGYVDVDSMKISGSGHVEGDIKVSGDLETSGSLVAEKSIEAGKIDSSGSLRAGNIKAGDIDSSGSLRVEGNVDADLMDISGSCVADNIKCGALESSGVISVNKLKGEKIEISGGVKAETVECDTFYMSIDGTAHRNTIGILLCKVARIETKRRLFKSSVEIGELRCTNAYLESVKAKKVIGDEIVVGDGCEIDYVEAKVLKTTGDAVVREKKLL